MQIRKIGETGLSIPVLGFGAFKIGRNEGIKYAHGYELPSLPDVARLLNSVLTLGCRYFDTAPAYGLSEERLGDVLAHVEQPLVISTKVGETFTNGVSTYDYSRSAVTASLTRSLQRLRRTALDLVFVHSNGDDVAIQRETDVVAVLREWKQAGRVRAVGFSGKTVAGAELALDWADALMVEYHQQDESHAAVMHEAARRSVAVIVKKGLASGKLPPASGIPFVLAHPAVTSMVIGGLNVAHFEDNWNIAQRILDANSLSPSVSLPSKQ